MENALAEARKSEAQLREIVDAIPQTITIMAPDGSTIYANQAVLDYTGLTADEVLNGNFRDRVFHPEPD